MKEMRKRHYLKASAAATIVSVGFAATAASAQTQIRIADFLPSNHIFYTCSMEQWVEEITAQHDDLVNIRYFGAGTVLGATEILDGVRQGAADMGVMVVDYWPDRLSLASFASLPFVFPDPSSGTAIIHELLEGEMGANFAAEGITPVMVLLTTPRQISMARPQVESLADFDGLKLRAIGWEGRTLEALGSSIVTVSPAEVATSQNTGIIDGSTQTYYGMPGWGLTDVTRQVVELRGYTHTLVVLGAATTAWESWSDEVRGAVSEISREIEGRWIACQTEADDAVREEMLSAGVSIYRISDEELETARERSSVVLDAWLASTGDAGQRLMDQYEEIISR